MILLAILAIGAILLLVVIMSVKLSASDEEEESSTGNYYCQSSTDRTTQSSLSSIMEKLVNSRPIKTVTLSYTDRPYRFACVNKLIWVAGGFTGVIEVVPLDMEGVTTPTRITPNSNLRARSLLQVNQSDVLMASPDGLFVLNMAGNIKYKVSDGEFTDVTMNSSVLLAIEKQHTKQAAVHKLVYKQNRLQLDTIVTTLQAKKLYIYITLLLHNDKVYIADYWHNIVKMHRLDGSGVYELVPGDYGLPLATYSDSSGSILICNKQNHTFQVIRKDGASKRYELNGISQPFDFIIIKDFVYIMWQHKTQYTVHVTMYNLPTF